MTTTDDPAAGSTEPAEADIANAGMQVLGMFAAICGAPDDPEVAAQARQALAHLRGLLEAA
jgi:hypothetical protein